MNKKILFIIIILSFIVLYFFSLDVPFLSGRVNDYANILDNNTISLLENKLAGYEKETTNQIAILIIPSLEGESLEEFSIKTAEKWKLGYKGKDNGVLLLIALNDRKLRIEVGYGLEESLTDIKCGQIIRNKITPYFKANNYKEGLIQGVDSIISVIGGNDDFDNKVQINDQFEKRKQDIFDSGLDIFSRILFGLFIFGIIGLFTFIGIIGPKGFPGWFLYVFLIPFWAMFPIVVVGTKIAFYIVCVYLVGYPLAKILLNIGSKHFPGLNKLQGFFGGSGGGSSSGFSSSSSSGSYSSSSSSSSSFSGGGGSFGGGGSSGSW